MKLLADRMNCIDASGIRKVFALAAQLSDPVNLSIGQPDYDVDEAVKEVAVEQIRAGFNRYTQTWGVDELRTACSEYYQRTFGAPLENVMITGGVSGGLFLALTALVDPGDEVLFADPYFVMYKHLVNLLGGRPVAIDTYPDFKLTPDRIEAAITPRTKLLLVNAPSNPTGVTMTGDELQAIADTAEKRGIFVISDEIYESLTYDGVRASMAGRCERLMILNGFSKNAAMTGWRIGYAAGPEAVIQAMNTLQQYTFVCAPSFAQMAAIEALQADMTPKLDAYRRKRDLIYEGLRDLGFRVTKPGGAFYIFPEAPGGDGDAFVAEAIRNNLLVIPGSVFSDRATNFRVSFAAEDKTIQRGLEILKKLV